MAEAGIDRVPHFADDTITLWHGDSLEVLRELPDGSVDCCVTSPPYFGLRDYGSEGQYGLEATPALYVETMRALFAEVRRVLSGDGTLWLNLGDSYDASKNLMGIPWRVAFALQDDGWTLRNDIVWSKPNAMPESVTDRLSSRHEHLFMLTKGRRYWFDLDPVREPVIYPAGSSALNWARDTKEADVPGQSMRQHRIGRSAPTSDVSAHDPHSPSQPSPSSRVDEHAEQASDGSGMSADYRPDPTPYAGDGPQLGRARTGRRRTYKGSEAGRNPGDVWSIPTAPFSAAHFAVYPPALAERCVLAGCKPGGTVLDPFSGSGTTGMVATKHGRKYVGIDLSRDYLDLSLRTRFAEPGLNLGSVS